MRSHPYERAKRRATCCCCRWLKTVVDCSLWWLLGTIAEEGPERRESASYHRRHPSFRFHPGASSHIKLLSILVNRHPPSRRLALDDGDEVLGNFHSRQGCHWPTMASQPRQRQEQHRRQQWRLSSTHCLPLMLTTTAAIASFMLAPTATAAANSRRIQQQQSNADEELIELFDQVTNNQTTVTTTIAIDTTSSNVARIDDDTLDVEEVVSGGIVYSTCPDLSAVSGPLYESDTNSDGFINQEEYVQFTDAISGGLLTLNGWEGGFNDMPLSLQETYLVLSCLCELYPGQPWGGVGCCKKNAITGSTDGTGIRTDGAQPGTTPDADQRQYLTYVCGTMSESLENVGGTIVAPPPTTPTPSSSLITSEPTTMQPVFMPVRNNI